MNLLALLPRFRAARRALRELEARERWPRADIDALCLERLNALWAHAIRHVPYYRRLAALGLPPRFGDLAEFRAFVPVLPKEKVRACKKTSSPNGRPAAPGAAAADRRAAP